MGEFLMLDAVSRSVDYVIARNDRDGNPRRGWVLTYRSNNGTVVGTAFINEGHAGAAAYFRALPHFDRTFDPTMREAERITVAEYDRLMFNHEWVGRVPLVPCEQRCDGCAAGRTKVRAYNNGDHVHA